MHIKLVVAGVLLWEGAAARSRQCSEVVNDVTKPVTTGDDEAACLTVPVKATYPGDTTITINDSESLWCVGLDTKPALCEPSERAPLSVDLSLNAGQSHNVYLRASPASGRAANANVTVFPTGLESFGDVWFGNGCYWARQYLFVTELEQKQLGRYDNPSSTVGYAGARPGAPARACYFNENNIADHDKQGHAEVLKIDVNGNKELEMAAAIYLDSFIQVNDTWWEREDVFDQGPSYRSVIGVPGGLFGPLGDVIRRANANVGNRMRLMQGQGSEEDTFGTSIVWVHDSDDYAFHPATPCMQYHDDAQVTYPEDYHDLGDELIAKGFFVDNGCPKNYIC